MAQTQQNAKRSGYRTQKPRGAGRSASLTNSSPASAGSSIAALVSPLHLGYVPGTEGSGRVAATLKAGLSTLGAPYGISFDGSQFPMTLSQVAVLYWSPMLTALEDSGDRSVITTAMFKYYNDIRSRNASISNFSPIDVFFAMCAVSGVATLLTSIRVRLQILCSAGSQINMAFPDTLMNAYRLTATDRTNLSSYIYKYNQIVALSKGLIMPKTFTYFARHGRLAGSVFLDDPMIDKSQLIVMRPISVWKWVVDATSPDVGRLVHEPLTATISQDIDLAYSLIQAYTLDQDMNNIYAEIRKAFTDGEVYQLQTFPIDGEGLSLEFEQVLLDEIKNAVYVGDLLNDVKVRENTTTGELEYVDPLDVAVGLGLGPNAEPFNPDADAMETFEVKEQKLFVYSHSNQPGESEIADLLAFKVAFKNPDDNPVISSCGSEVIHHAEVHFQLWNGTQKCKVVYGINQWDPDTDDTQNTISQCIETLRMYFAYSSLPPIDMVTNGTNGDSGCHTCIEGDVDNRFPITFDALRLVHRASVAYLVTFK